MPATQEDQEVKAVFRTMFRDANRNVKKWSRRPPRRSRRPLQAPGRKSVKSGI